MPKPSLEAMSAVGSGRESSGALIISSPHLSIKELPWLQVLSLRASRMHTPEPGLSAMLKPLWLQAPESANGLRGSPQSGCSWLEPRAWLLVSESAIAIPQHANWLITDISDRVAVFGVEGECARSIIAAGCDPHLVRPGTMARTRFAGMANVIVEQWTETGYRLLIDVSVAGVFAAWLGETVGNVSV